MSEEFVNSYHFVPVRELSEGDLFAPPQGETPRDFGHTAATAGEGHAIYARDHFSGRLTLRLTAETPIAVGAKRRPVEGESNPGGQKYNVVEPYLYGGKAAIPAATLKGCLGAIIEAASASALRVLDDDKLSARVPAAKGTVRKYRKDGAGEKKTRHHFGALNGLSDDLLPMSSKRSRLTLAERMLGFVNEDGGGERLPVALAGKLRFSHGVCEDAVKNPENSDPFKALETGAGAFQGEDFEDGHFGQGFVRLKELAEPLKKPKQDPEKSRSVTPAFYFKRAAHPAKPLTKSEFIAAPDGEIHPQGRKFYLHSTEPDKQPWRTAARIEQDRQSGAAQRKSAVRLLKKGVSFVFAIDFDNLSEQELNVLCFTARPSERFRHKIGVGKNVGLGSVRSDPHDLMLIDRGKRYREECVFSPDPRSIHREPNTIEDGEGAPGVRLRAGWHSTKMRIGDPQALAAILAIGERHDFDQARPGLVPVLSVPLTTDKFEALQRAWGADSTPPANVEDESFRWFQANERQRASMQMLTPIACAREFPTLKPLAPVGGGGSPSSPATTVPPLAPGVQMRGMVKWFDPDKGYGFIQPDGGGEDVFVRIRAVRDAGLRDLREGQTLSFEAVPGKKPGQLQAEKLRLVPPTR